MLNPSEALLQFIWQHKLFNQHPLICKSGNALEIIKQGELNKNSGPDFFNAQIKINGLLLAGNIELHVKTSDWLKHGHQNDMAYNTIILHAVFEHDVELEQNTLHHVEVLELKNFISQETLKHYDSLFSSKTKIACQNQLHRVNDFKFISWIDRMAIERLEYKTERIESYFQTYKGDFTQTFYTLLLRNFGFGVNAEPFELLAKHLPFAILFKHANNLIQVESLLLGMAGLLDNSFDSKYLKLIQNEFDFLKNKYHLLPLKKELFKFSKMRPANFPTVRLAQLAAIVHFKPQIFTQPQNYMRVAELRADLSISLSEYWQYHFTLDSESTNKELTLGKNSIDNILMNTFAPFYFFYSKKTNHHHYHEMAFRLLESAAFELNTKTKLFSTKQALLKSGISSQALLNLFDNYCVKKRCLNCAVAAELLKPI